MQALNAHPTAIFTAPDTVVNKYVALNLSGTTALDDTTSLQAAADCQHLTQRVTNGATAEVAPCDNGTGELCNDDGTPVTSRDGRLVGDFRHGATYCALVLEGLDAQSYGGSAQVTTEAPVFGLKNHLALGASFDGSESVFDAQTQLGGYDPRGGGFVAPGTTRDQPSEGTTPVRVATTTRHYGVFAADLLTLLPQLDLSLGGRVPNALGGRLSRNADYDHTNDQDDLVFQTAPDPNLAFYTNAGRMLRQGVEANLHYDTQRLHGVLGYAYTNATFQTPLLLGSGSNPQADANGNEHVQPDDRIPGIPQHRFTATAEYKITARWSAGGNATLQAANAASATKPS